MMNSYSAPAYLKSRPLLWNAATTASWRTIRAPPRRCRSERIRDQGLFRGYHEYITYRNACRNSAFAQTCRLPPISMWRRTFSSNKTCFSILTCQPSWATSPFTGYISIKQRESTEQRSFSSDTRHSVVEEVDETPSIGLFRLLTEEEREMVRQQRLLTARGRMILDKLGLSSSLLSSGKTQSLSTHPDSPIKVDDETWADATFRIVIAGEYNAGKSTLINALLGKSILETGPLPTTDVVTILSHPQHDRVPSGQPEADDATRMDKTIPMNPASTSSSSSVMHYRVEHPLLQDVTLIDTPGTNAVLQDHTARTLALLPTIADLILFVTSADRPLSQSERDLLESISEYRKHIVVVVNKMDILEQTGGNHGDIEKKRVVSFVTEHARDLLGGPVPIVLAVSARDALAAKKLASSARSAVWERSQFAALEEFLQTSLTTETKIKAKLSSPVGVLQAAVEKGVIELERLKEVLSSDIRSVQLLESQWVGWRKQMAADLGDARREMVQTVSAQGDRSWKILQRLDSTWDFCFAALTPDQAQSLAHKWKQTEPLPPADPSSSAPSLSLSMGQSSKSEGYSLQEELLAKSLEIADSMAVRGRAHGQTMIESLGSRPGSRSSSLVGSVTAASRFEETRQQLAQQLNAAIRRHVDTLDQQAQHEQRLLARWQQVVQVAVGSGTIGTLGSAALIFGVWEPSNLAFQVGLFGAGSLGSISLSALLLGTSRWQTARQYAEHYKAVSQELDEAVESVAGKELDRVHRRIQDGVAPYTRFVQAEQERIENLLDECDAVATSAKQLRKQIATIRS